MKLPSACALLIGLTSGAAAQSQNMSQDIRCMLVTTHYSQASKDARTAPLLSLASNFYLGRVDRGVPAADLERLMRAEAQALQGTKTAAIVRGCTSYMLSRVNHVQRIGQSVSRSMK